MSGYHPVIIVKNPFYTTKVGYIVSPKKPLYIKCKFIGRLSTNHFRSS